MSGCCPQNSNLPDVFMRADEPDIVPMPHWLDTLPVRPVIEEALKKTDATKYWKDVFTAYNKFSANPVNTDLSAYVTSKAVDGIFFQVGLEEQKIRKDPVARVSDILKKVFGSKEATGN